MNYFSEILFFFGAIGVFNSLLVSIYFLVGKSLHHLTGKLFGLFLLALNVRVIKSLFYAFSTEEPIFFLQSGPSFFLLTGPLLFLYVANSIQPAGRISKSWKIHIVFWIIVILMLLISFPFSSNVAFNKKTLLPLINLQWLLYIIASGYFLTFPVAGHKHVSVLKKWLALLIFSVLILWSVYFFTNFNYFISGSIIFSILFYAFFLYFLFNKKRSAQIFKNPKKSDPVKTDEIINRLVTVMKEDKLYTNPNLKSSDVAQHLKISTHELSRLINEYLGKSFTDFINYYRIEEAKQLIKTNSIYTLEAIGNEAGFNSKSAFYNAFKKFSGTTPAKYKAKF